MWLLRVPVIDVAVGTFFGVVHGFTTLVALIPASDQAHLEAPCEKKTLTPARMSRLRHSTNTTAQHTAVGLR